MNFTHSIYLLLLGTCFILSLTKIRGYQLKIFPYLLTLSVITETLVNIFYLTYRDETLENLIYQIYIPIEFLILIIFFKQNSNSKIVIKCIYWSIPVFFIGDFVLIYIYGVKSFPGHILNLEGIIVSILACNMLLNLPIDINTPIYRMSLLWVSLGLLTYYSSSFIFNGLYNYLFTNAYSTYSFLQSILMKFPNYLLYIFLSVGFLCSKSTQK